MAKYCKICNVEIPPRRVALGYKTTCVLHSEEEMFTSFISATAKTDYETIIVRDKESAKQIKTIAYTYR